MRGGNRKASNRYRGGWGKLARGRTGWSRRRARRSRRRKFGAMSDLAALGRSGRVWEFIHFLRGVGRGRRATSQDRGQGRNNHLRDTRSCPRSGDRAGGGPGLGRGVRFRIHRDRPLRLGRASGERARRTSRTWEFALEFARGAQVAGGTTGRGHRHNASHYVFLTVNAWDL